MQRDLRSMLVLIVWVSAALTAHGQAQNVSRSNKDNASRPMLEFSDQFNRTNRLVQYRGNVVVLVYGDRKGTDASKALGKVVHTSFHPSAANQPPQKAQQAPVRPLANWPANTHTPDVKVIPVACIGDIPGFIRPIIANRFRAAVPDVPVWLDMENQMKETFGLAEGVANLVVIDTEGRYRYRLQGQLNQQQLQGLVNAIEQLRYEARPNMQKTSNGQIAPGQ